MSHPVLLPPVRRVVTQNREDGRSHFAADGAPLAQLTLAERPGYRSANVWRTLGALADVGGPDTSQDQVGVLPPPGGTVLRVIDFPPQPRDAEERRRQAEVTFRRLFPDAQHDPKHLRDVGMHQTRTVDYAIVLVGTITAILDEGETDLRAGDILIQRGTSHAWANRTDEVARVAFVLIDGR